MNSPVPMELSFLDFTTLALLIIVIVFQYLLGFSLFQQLARLTTRLEGNDPRANLGETRPSPATIPAMYLLGLLVHLALVLMLKSLNFPWWLASYCPFLIVALNRHHVMQALELLSCSLKYCLSPSFIIWFIFHAWLGFSIFNVSSDIRTPWVNNYGDLTFHLGMISHFTFVGDFPPQYHLFAGEKLSYPFFVNLWAAILWWPSSNLVSLPLIFMAQWLLVWSCIYAFLNGKRYVLIPWALLLGGGSYVAIIQYPEVFSWSKINEGFPFTTWLSTIWVTQRSAMMGAVCCLASCHLVLNSQKNSVYILVAGLILGMMPLAHTHYFVVTALFLGLLLVWPAMCQTFTMMKEGSSDLKAILLSALWQKFYLLFVPSLLALVFFPLLLGKSGMVSLMPGWSVPVARDLGEGLARSGSMWLANASHWFVVMFVVAFFIRRKSALVFLVLLFVLANSVKLAVWDWDQLKAFLAIFTIFLVVWSSSDFSFSIAKKIFPAKGWASLVLVNCLAVLLIIPGAYEFYRVFKKPPNYQVYDAEKLEIAAFIREVTAKDAIVATPTDHNSAATLSGRSLYMGYPGTLASHKIEYRERENIQRTLVGIERCETLAGEDSAFCPGVIVWDRSAMKTWSNQKIPGSFGVERSDSFPKRILYKVNKEK